MMREWGPWSLSSRYLYRVSPTVLWASACRADGSCCEQKGAGQQGPEHLAALRGDRYIRQTCEEERVCGRSAALMHLQQYLLPTHMLTVMDVHVPDM